MTSTPCHPERSEGSGSTVRSASALAASAARTPQLPLLLALLLISILALALRLPDLSLRPMHNDEAVHAIKFRGLWERGLYRYDPDEFHGPTLYYLTLPAMYLVGTRDFASATEATFRAVPVFFAVASILLLWLLRDALGHLATAAAALLLATSPAAVFYSRYYIHETLFVFFTLASIACAWRYSRRPSLAWAIATGSCLALMFATKETAVIPYAAMLLSLAAASLWTRRADRMRSRAIGRTGFIRPLHLIAAFATGVFLAALVYSSFLSHPQGLLDALRTFGPWSSRVADNTPHLHSWHYYLSLLTYTHRAPGPVWSESLVLLLAFIGLLSIVFPRVHDDAARLPFLRFLAIYALLLTAIYSLIPYKTPWNLLGFLAALILLAGRGASFILRAVRPLPLKISVALILSASVAHLTWQAYITSYRFPADQRNPYVYAQSVPDVLRLARRVEQFASLHPRGRDLLIRVIASPYDTWPLPWHLRAFPNVGYWHELPAPADAPIVIVSPDFASAVDSSLHDQYHTEHFGLRSDVILQLHVREDLWTCFLQTRAPTTEGVAR